MSGPVRPPRLARRLVRSLVDGPEREHLLGDLAEGFRNRAEREGAVRAGRWYWRQTLILLWGLGGRRLRHAMAPGALALDLRRALRSLARSPGLTAAGVAVLGLGIAAPTATFGIIEGMFSKLPVERPHEVVSVRLVDRESGNDFGAPYEVFREWRERATGFAALGAFQEDDQAVSGQGFAPSREEAAALTPEVFAALGVAPLLGRTFDDADARPGAAPAALIGEELWEEWYDRDPGVLGARVRVGEGHYTVVGVMPADFGFPESHRVWTILTEPVAAGHGLAVVGRLSPDAPVERARAELSALLQSVRTNGTGTETGGLLERAGVRMDEYVLSFHSRRTRTLLGALTVLVGFLVVIAAANLSALFLARGTTRSAETALRMSIGGSRFAVVRPLMIEALVLSAGGAVLGLVLAHGVTSWMAATLEARGAMPYWAEIGLSAPVLGFAAVLMAGAALVAGVLPALRTSRVDLPEVMKAGRTGPGPGRVKILPVLVGTEVALACVLLVMSGFVVRAAVGMVQRVGSFPVDGVLTAELVLEDYDYPDIEARRLFWSELERTLAADPAVEDFTVASAMPGDGTSDAWIALEGEDYEREQDWPRAQRRVVDERFFAMFGMETLAGRTFTAADTDEAPPVAVVNEAWVREHLRGGAGADRAGPGGAAVGRRIRVRERGGEPVTHEIVGLVADPGVSVDDGERVAAVFIPTAQRRPERAQVAVRPSSAGAGASTSAALRALSGAVHAIDAELPLDRVMTLEALVRRENDGGRVLGTLFGLLGAAALLLAVVGLHGVVSFTTARRTYEIGVMRALGAPEAGVLMDTVRRGLRPVVVGLVPGLGLSWLLTPLIGQELLEGAGGGPHDPVVFGAVTLVLLAGAGVAVFGPALRASRVDPLRALRAE